jgi:ATP-binding cassette, subfamily B, bacterial
VKEFKTYRQLDLMDCGPTCLRMVAQYYGKHFTLDTLRHKSQFSKEGVSLLGISDAAETIGFRTRGVQLSFEELIKEAPKPCIIHWDQQHFVVLVSTKKAFSFLSLGEGQGVGLVRSMRSRRNSGERKNLITVADPAKGLVEYDEKEFVKHWLSSKDEEDMELGVALLLEPTPAFHQQKSEKKQGIGWGYLMKYVWQHRPLFIQLAVGLLLGSLLSLAFPFLTQNIVDVGISNQNLGFIYVMLLAQTMLFFSRTVVDFIRSRILLYISTRINISILSDFWIKLMKLPMSFFDTKMTGDIIQRIGDHRRIESFLTNATLSVLFSVFNLVLYTIILLYYNWLIFIIYAAGSVLYYIWIKLFLSYRRKLDNERFAISAKENTATMQLINGMQEIKLNNAEHLRRWEWENLQAQLFKLSFRSLSISQIQQAGAFFINEGKNILITFFVAKSVIEGQLTLGAMLAVQYIIGQLNGPIEQLIGFVQQAQDAKISLERLNEIHSLTDEETMGLQNEEEDKTKDKHQQSKNKSATLQPEADEAQLLAHLPTNKTLAFNNVTFTYSGAGNEPVLKDIDLVIPEKKITAIVGTSGSGKTTLIKLLLRFYNNYSGDIRVGATPLSLLVSAKDEREGQGVRLDEAKNREQGASVLYEPLEKSTTQNPASEGGGTGMRLSYISPKYWRSQCGSVMQDGYIFNDNIAKNIAVSEERPNYEKLVHAAQVANILEFIEGLPLGFNTKIGAEGNGISQGQKQRILIARAVYKNPEYIFFDEATNALDANNEKVIIENLNQFFKEKTVIIVAHRLSTVKNADNIVVLEHGKIIEQGTHEELSNKKGKYYELVKNQLELGN